MTEKPEADGVVTVAELLARHGQASGTAGRAHRRRAREGGITVAELTGEIPVVRDAEVDEPAVAVAVADEAPVEDVAAEEAPADETPADETPADEPAPEEPAAKRAYSALDAVADAGPQSPREFASATAFPVMSPLARSIMSADAPDESSEDGPADAPVAEYKAPAEPAEEKGAVRQWLSLGVQAVVGVAVGAALFVGFERLWDSLPYVALVLAILVILAMVAVVRILRKTDDIVSVLIAVVVGVIVTIGPLAFVLSTS